MKILAFLDESNDQATFYDLKDGTKNDLLNVLKNYFKNCYICQKKYDELKERDLTHKDIIESKIPTRGNIKSGEFGEILTNKLLEELNTKAESIKKWRWKEDKNKPVQKIDVVLLQSDPNKPKESDKLIVAEVKASATSNRYSQENYCQIQNAINDIEKEQDSRLAKALIWIKDKAVGDGDVKLKKLVERFLKSGNKAIGDFKIEKNAVGVIDKELIDKEISRVDLENKKEDINVVVVTIKNLKEIYEGLFKKMYDET